MKKKKLKLIDKVKRAPKFLTSDISVLEEALGGDKELILFFLSYLKHDRNASQAYKYLHPGCTDDSCRVLGSRQLAKVNINIILESYDLGIDTYIKKIKEGLEASEIEIINARIKKGKKGKNGKKDTIIYQEIKRPNHAVQDKYHTKLGELLGINGSAPTTNVAVQVNNLINEKKNKYGI